MTDIIDLYKPNPVVSEAFDIDERQEDSILTFDIFRKLVLARKTQDLVFLSIGRMLKLVRDRELYKHLDFDDFKQFLESEEISFSRAKAYLYIRAYELFVEKLGLNQEEVGKLGVKRLMLLHPIIKDLPKDQAIQKIEESEPLRYNDFVRQVKEEKNKDGKPSVYFSDEHGKWIVRYYENTTMLLTLGTFTSQEEKDE